MISLGKPLAFIKQKNKLMREKKQTPVRRETKKNTHQTIILKKHKCLKTGHPTIKQFIIIFPDKHMQYSI